MRWLHKWRTPRLRLDLAPGRPSTRSGWLLVVVACGFAADVTWRYVDVRARTSVALSRLGGVSGPPAGAIAAKVAYHPADAERETAFARGVVTRIRLPWSELFTALEKTRVDEVSLLSVEPEAQSRNLRLNGEARDIPAMLTYVARLEAEPYFRNVTLLQNELKRDGRGNTVTFVVSASWRGK